MTSSRRSTPILGIGLLWLAIAIALAATGQLTGLQPPIPQIVVIALTVALILAGRFVPAFREWLAGLPLRALIALHITRLVGITFLVYYGRGELPWAFAVPGGIGDIVVATAALVLVLFVPALNQKPGLVVAWNAVGLIDILFVVAAAARLGIAEPASMAALLRLPLSLLPTFLVPIIIASHLLIFARVRQTTI